MASESSKSSVQKKKTLYLIRHAESEENRRLASLQTVVASLLQCTWPSSTHVCAALELMNVCSQIDSPVSTVGKQQINTVRNQMSAKTTNLWLNEINAQAILHSPLQRAKDTCLGLFQQPDGSNNHHPIAVPIEESMLLLEKTPTEWVFPKSFLERLQDFQEHVWNRPEERFVIVGHSQFFKALLKLNFKFDNCDVWKVELCGGSSSSNNHNNLHHHHSLEPPVTMEPLPPQWSNLQPLLACKELVQDNDDNPVKES